MKIIIMFVNTDKNVFTVLLVYAICSICCANDANYSQCNLY